MRTAKCLQLAALFLVLATLPWLSNGCSVDQANTKALDAKKAYITSRLDQLAKDDPSQLQVVSLTESNWDKNTDIANFTAAQPLMTLYEQRHPEDKIEVDTVMRTWKARIDEFAHPQQ